MARQQQETVDKLLTELSEQINQTKRGITLSKVKCCGTCYVLSIDNVNTPIVCPFCGRVIEQQ